MTTYAAPPRNCRDHELTCDPNIRLSSASAQPLILQPVNANGARICPTFPSLTIICINILIVALGTISILANTIAVTQTGRIAYTGAGFWCNFMFIVTGSLGTSAARTKTKCMIVSHLLMCVTSASFTLLQFTVTIVKSYVDGYPIFSCHPHCAKIGVRVVIGMYVVVAVCSLVNTILGIVCAAICSKTLCCTKNPQTTHMFLQGNQRVQYVVVNQSSSAPTSASVDIGTPYPGHVVTPVPPQVSSTSMATPPAYALNPPPYSYVAPQAL